MSNRLSGARAGLWPALLVAILALVIGGCGSSGSGGGTDGGSGGSTAPAEPTEGAKLSSADVPEVTMALTGTEISLNLLTAPTVPTIALMGNVAQGMLAYGADGELENGLATSWKEVSPTEYTYKLKPGARFSTGAPVTTEDVLYSLRYEANPKTGSVTSSFFLSVKSIEQAGPNEIRVKLKKPDPTWRYVPGDYPAWIYEKKSLVDAGESFGSAEGVPVGSGPYAISEFTSDHITFVRNKYYAGPKPPVAKFVIHLVADPGTSLAAMQSGEIDGALFVPLQSTNQWSSIPNTELYSTPSPAYDVIWYNTTKEPFTDPHVRRALLYAFDREGVANSVLNGSATVYPNVTIQPQFWLNEMSEAEAKKREAAGELGREYPFSIARAKEELAKSKVPDGFTAKVQYPSSAPELGLAMQAWAQTLKEIGVNLEVEQFGDTSFYTKQTNGEFEMQVSTGAWDYPDPLDLNLILCGCSIPPNGFNATRFNNAEVNQLFKESFADTNQKTRVDKLVKLVKIATEEVPNPALWVRSAVTALNSELGMSNLGPWSYNSAWMTDIGKVTGG